ncbi:NAD(P)H-binding domain-containing protein [Hirsutella rhossiliensis]|uniref:NAD(P)H-binding domain-containing protein n=1 Tax=Hirsutella rhossiliensis TaxID=111463 RepID=A0A9P8SMU9_9HYPO|nr:NAD(P)H-binding domain-containing protein [Hirsutella rhossiliensis]KAH0967684.1 NAD(P)H-binding domain-containing protein [Hirsutella rhossiliensis]
MRITIAPAGTKTGTAVVRSLLSTSDPVVEVHGLYRNLAKVPDEFSSQPRFHALQGDVLDPLRLHFTGSDAILAITPPVYDGQDIVSYAEIASKNVRDAIERSGSVKRLVLLSSGGAQFSTGVGEIKTNNMAERVFSMTAIPAVTFVRCAYFMENWTMNFDTLKAPQPFFFSTITPLDWRVPMVAVDDIGSTLAAELLNETIPPTKPHIFELHGPQPYTPLDVQAAFSKVLKREVAVKPVAKNELYDFFSRIFPQQIVGEWVEMAASFLPGGIMAADTINYDDVNVVRGVTELDTALAAAIRKNLLGS